MANVRTYTFRGSDAPRARALWKARRKPKFALGDVVLDGHGDIAAIDAIFADFQAVDDTGQLGNAADWLRRQKIKPKTPKTGVWYSLVYGFGTGVAGELDLKRAPDGASSKPDGD